MILLHPIAVPPARRDGVGYDCGKDRSRVFRDDLPTWDPTPENVKARSLRRASGLTLGEVSRAVGIGVAEVSGLEYGAQTLTAEEWAAYHAWLTDQEAM